MSGKEVIRCEKAPKALYFPSKLHKIIISKAYNSAPNLSIFTYDASFGKERAYRLQLMSKNCYNLKI